LLIISTTINLALGIIVVLSDFVFAARPDYFEVAVRLLAKLVSYLWKPKVAIDRKSTSVVPSAGEATARSAVSRAAL
jgi:hypothetical protein